MGAYYEYQITYPIVLLEERTVCLPTLGGRKFLENFYARSGNTLVLLSLLKEYGASIVNTVCDYDEAGAFEYAVPYAENDVLTKHEKKLVERIKKMDETDWRDCCASFLGFTVICDERKEYVHLSPFMKANWAVSPIALLTRSSKDSQGGGDFDVDDVNCDHREFFTNEKFDPDMVGAWKDCKIRLDDCEPDGYADVTAKVFLDEKC